MEFFPGLAKEADSAGRIHPGGRELARRAAVVRTNVKVGGCHVDCHLAEVGVKVQKLVVCVGINQWVRG